MYYDECWYDQWGVLLLLEISSRLYYTTKSVTMQVTDLVAQYLRDSLVLFTELVSPQSFLVKQT